jgi:predicted nucleic acid-binding protein
LIVLDTSGVVALLDGRDRSHERATSALAASGPPVTPAMALAEMAFMVTSRAGEHVFRRFLEGFEDGSTLLDCGDVDPPRIRELMTRYADLPLGFADAAVVACAERNGGRILTFDRRDFDVIAADTGLTILPS